MLNVNRLAPKCLMAGALAVGILSVAGCQMHESQATTTTQDNVKSTSNSTAIPMLKAAVPVSEYDRPGFFTAVKDGRLWVFVADSKDLAEFKKTGEPAKVVTRIGQGPNGMTIKAPDSETIDAYLSTK